MINTKPLCICSGYFAPLHDGHLQYFSHAIEYVYNQTRVNPSLYVIVNNDRQLELKGRITFINERVRRQIVNSLQNVKIAFISIDNDLSIAKTLDALLYDDLYNVNLHDKVYFVNSGDRKKANSQEHQVCKKYGVEEVFIDLPKINSSNKILQDIGFAWYHKRQTNINN